MTGGNSYPGANYGAQSPSGPTPMPDDLLQLLPKTFSSRDAFKTEFLATAEAMFGSGWVWLIQDRDKCLRILCTYNAGTPFGAAHRRQSTDMNTRQTLGSSAAADLTEATRRGLGSGINNWAIPLLNIPIWQHAWLEDFGVLGKEEYLEACWNAIDWNVVASRVPLLFSTSTIHGHR